jgi:hypothetical protein
MLTERTLYVSRCHRCGQSHGTTIVRRVPMLLVPLWFFICWDRQEPMYIEERYVS